MKQSAIEKAIAVLEGERQVLDLAIAKLKAQRDSKPKRAPKPQAVSERAS